MSAVQLFCMPTTASISRHWTRKHLSSFAASMLIIICTPFIIITHSPLVLLNGLQEGPVQQWGLLVNMVLMELFVNWWHGNNLITYCAQWLCSLDRILWGDPRPNSPNRWIQNLCVWCNLYYMCKTSPMLLVDSQSTFRSFRNISVMVHANGKCNYHNGSIQSSLPANSIRKPSHIE